MSWPSGDHAASQPDLGANQEGARADQFLSVRTLSHQAQLIVAEKDLCISGSRIRKLVRRFVMEGRSDLEFRRWFLGYADPTGETAVRRVMRERA